MLVLRQKNGSSEDSSSDSSCSSESMRKRGKSKPKSEVDSFLKILNQIFRRNTLLPKRLRFQSRNRRRVKQPRRRKGGKTEEVNEDDESVIGEKTEPETIRKIRKYSYDGNSEKVMFYCAPS